jgi:Co/Zn/Cd efflux system component
VIATSGWPAEILPTALLIAASPASYLAALTLLTTERPLANAWAFASGWFIAVFGIFIVTYAITSPSPPKAASGTNSTVSAILGLAAIVASVVIWRKQRAAHGATSQPKWLARMERIRPVASFALGFFLPTYGLIPPAAIHLKDMHVSGTTAWVASITFGLVATLGVILPVVLYSASTSLRDRLRGLRDTAVANQLRIAAVLLAVLGLSLLASAITTILSLHKIS